MMLVKLDSEIILTDSVEEALTHFYNMGFPVYEEKLFNDMEFFTGDNIKAVKIVFKEKIVWAFAEND